MSRIRANRRKYIRVDINIPCVLYIDDIELNGKIIDICEDGIAFEFDADTNIDKTIFKKLGSKLKFASYDKYEYLGPILKKQYFVGQAEVVWSDGIDVIGCELIDIPRALESYITDKKVVAFVKNGFHF